MLTDFRLKVFTTVAHTLNFTRAAAELNVSQPAVTNQIKELEKSLGESLFVRKQNSITLTEKGEWLLPLAQDILERYEVINGNSAPKPTPFEGQIHIGASTTLAQYILPAALSQFQQRYPNIKIVMSVGNSDEVSQRVIAGELDLAIVESDSSNRELHYEQYANDKIVLVTASDGATTIGVEELKYIPLAVREVGSGTLGVVEKALAKHQITRKNLNVVMQISDVGGLMNYVINSKCYTFVSTVVANTYKKQKQVKVVDVRDLQIVRKFRFATLHGKQNRLAELFKTFLLEQKKTNLK